MDAAAWLASLDRVGEEYRAARQAHWDKIAARTAPAVVAGAARPVVLEPGHDVEVGHEDVPASARRAAAAGLVHGWDVRVVRSVAADVRVGLLVVVTVRLRRGDERIWAGWSAGRFVEAWHVGDVTGLERLGGSRLASLTKAAVKRGAQVMPTTRGVLDAIEGVLRPDQWLDLLERQDVARATGLIAQAFPGLQLISH